MGQFQLSFLRFRGQRVVRFGPSSGSHHQLRIKIDDNKYFFLLNEDPADLKTDDNALAVDATAVDLPFGGKWWNSKVGDIIEPDPETKMNPAKTKIASFEVQDEGSAEVLDKKEGLLKFSLDGKKLSGSFILVQEEKGSDFWSMEKTEESPIESILETVEKDRARQVVYGIVMKPDVYDGHNDRISKEELEEAAWQFLKNIRNVPVSVAISHEEFTDAFVCESWILKQDWEIGDRVVKEGTWVTGVKIEDPEIWEQVMEEEFKGFSIGGWGLRKFNRRPD